MNDPLLTVIVPVYNTGKYLDKCIYSIVNQTYKNLEIIIVDDGSTDGSDLVCDKLKEIDNRIIVCHKKNNGVASARNYGLDRMNGEYVGFVDSDDWIESNFYETLYTNLKKYNAQISCCGIRRVKENEKLELFNQDVNMIKTFNAKEALIELQFNKIITAAMCDKIYERKLFDGLRIKEGRLYEDGIFMPYCIVRADKICYTGEPLYYYSMTPNSLTRSKFSMKRYDALKNNREGIEFYKKYCPEGINYVYANYYRVCLEVLDESFDYSDWDEIRQKEFKYIKNIMSLKTMKRLPLLQKIKLFLMINNTKLYKNIVDTKRKIIP